MRDYSYKIYTLLIETLISEAYDFITFEEYCDRNIRPGKFVILRHDVDRLPWNALEMARIENKKNIKASYYFRIVKEAYNEDLIRQIVSLGHEAGYHYEDIDLSNGNIDRAYESYLKNLTHFQKFYPVRTICMHGSPLSKYDNRNVWQKYKYKENGIIGEPYFDIDYNLLFYITDTGRQWNNANISVRDKVNSIHTIKINNTPHLIKLIKQKQLPAQLMINTHPHRWFDQPLPWLREYVLQNIKNVGKRILVASKNNHEK
jgi:hypothetical protein